MDIETSYAVRLFVGNTSLAQVYYEAVANAFDAGAENIKIQIRMTGTLGDPTLDISIHDDGEGFSDENYNRFVRLVEPKDSRHKGIGRLVYLQYFRELHISSTFGSTKRDIELDSQSDASFVDHPTDGSTPSGTHIHFDGFLGARIHSYDHVKPSSLKERLLQEFLPLFHIFRQNQRSFRIEISLHTDTDNPQAEFFSGGVTLTENDVPELQSTEFAEPELDLFAVIKLWYLVQLGDSRPIQLCALNVDGRALPLKLLTTKAVPLDCTAVFIFESEIFNGSTDTSRQKLNLPDSISKDILFRVLRERMSAILADAVPDISRRNEATRSDYEQKYPHLVGLFEDHTVGLIDRDDAVSSAQARFFHQQKQVLEADTLDDDLFQQTLEVSARSLTEYILYRDYVVRKLSQTTPEQVESVVHDLIVPRGYQIGQDQLAQTVYRNNAWILDDKFMTFRTILSERRMDELIAKITLDDDVGEDAKRPDISMIFSDDPASSKSVDVVVVEIKRRGVDFIHGPYVATQLNRRAQKLVKACNNLQRVWYYGIIDIDSELKEILMGSNWIPMFSDKNVLYQELKAFRADKSVVPAPTFLMPFDAVIRDAHDRNHTFLELLRNSFRSVSTKSAPSDGKTSA